MDSEIRAHFDAYPWCRKIFDDPALVPIITTLDVVAPRAPATFMRHTLRDHDTIRARQSFYRRAETSATEETRPGELWDLCSIGLGVEGHERVSHGGFVSTLLDHHMGSIVTLHSRFGTPHTGSLHIDFKGPLPAPSAVLCRTWIASVEGRKIKTKGVLEGEDGTPIALGEALFISPPKL